MVTDAVQAVCFPHDDDVFVGRVHELVSTQASPSAERMQAAIEVLLRETYPRAVISARQSFAANDRLRIWYVFRDGSFLRPPGADA